MIYDKFHALRSLKPNGVFQWVGTEYSGLTGDDKPTEAELDAEVARLQADYDSKEYQRKRGYEYPDFGTQLDYIYHNGLEKWKTDIVDPVKAKYPKPS